MLIVLGTNAAPPRVSWIGNTFGDGSKWVQNNIADLFVGADGVCYTNSFWDEGGHEAGIYRDGDVIGACSETHEHGGFAVIANDRFIFLACTVNHQSGVRRYEAKSRQPTHFTPLAQSIGSLRGLAILGGQLLVTDFDANQVHVLTMGDMVERSTIAIDHPQRIAVGADGTLWFISGQPARVNHFRQDGKPAGPSIEGVDEPVALAFDQVGHLLVADNGPDQQIKRYDVSAKPELISSLGEKGGVFAGRRGLNGPLRFNGLTGVGCDAAGNVYVSHNGIGPLFRDHPGFGAELKCFSPEGKLKWYLQGLEFVETAAIDPGSQADVFTKDQHHVLDDSKEPGNDSTYRGFTLDRFRFPDDPRLHLSAECVLGVRRLNGRRFLYLSDMYSRFVIVYRFEAGSEIAIPCAMFGREHLKENWPIDQPASGAWLWHDLDGDGKMGALEFEGNAQDNSFVWGWSVDARGTVWKALRENGLRRFPLSGIDLFGAPIYRYADSTVEANPYPFIETPEFKGDINRAEYDAAKDVMYLAGYTPKHPNQPQMWGLVGTTICKYERWSAGNREPAWQLDLPYDTNAKPQVLPKAMAFAGDYLFVGYMQDSTVHVFDFKSGAAVTTFLPGRKVGWIDLPFGISAFQRSDGEYDVFAEEVWNGKIMWYRWR